MRLISVSYTHLCAENGITAFTGDGTNPDVMTMATKAIGAANGCGVPTIKPWNIDTIKAKMEQAKESGCFAVAKMCIRDRYETIAVSGRLALLKVKLITGRTHQIRAHMASIGCPILGDSKYGNNSANRELLSLIHI